ncbi:MAG: ATP-binding protein [Kofleriaceae bacterium]
MKRFASCPVYLGMAQPSILRWGPDVDAAARFEAQLEAVACAAERAAQLARGAQVEPDAPWPRGAEGAPARHLIERCGLREEEVELLWALAARAVDPRVAAHLRALDPRAREGLSLGLYAALRGLPPARAHALSAVADPRHPLRQLELISPIGASDDSLIDVETPLGVPQRVVHFLAGEDLLDAALARDGGLLRPPPRPLWDDAQAAVVEQLRGWLAPQEPTTLVLEGAPGSGRRAAIACAAAPAAAVMLDASRLGAADAPAALRALRREAALRGAAAVLADVDELAGRLGPGEQQALIAALGRWRGPLVLTTSMPGLELGSSSRALVRLRWPLPGVATRRALWARALEPRGPGAGAGPLTAAELDLLAERYRVGAGGVAAAVRSATARAARGARGPASPTLPQLLAGVQDNIAERLGELARRVDVSQAWSELVLPADTRDDVAALIGRVRHGHQVLEQWGFRRKLPRGAGVAALFSGPPGTGKTMVAGLIARELSLELYQVDLSRVVSKWVGETEKQLAKVFEAAEAGHALLLFDEADALFAKRSADVKSAVDRYANLEVNYLLQRIESFGGVVILTTNLDASIDPALRRRLAGHIVFGLPEAEEREQLWREMLSTGAPLAEGLDLASLAEEYAGMSGANIRNAVLAAAFLAASEGAVVGQAHLRRAARSEYRAMGHVLGRDARGGL